MPKIALKIPGIFILLFALTNASTAATNKKDAPEYLKEARLSMFMANEVVKYCGELVVDEEAYKKWYAQLQSRLASDGINSINEEVKPASLSEIFAGAQRIMDKNGGPFRFSTEKYCSYGRKQIKKRSDIGILLKDTR